MSWIARVIDYETTGTPEDPSAEILEFGRIDVDLHTKEIRNPWAALCKPRGPIPPVTKAVHHITESMVEDALSAADLWDEFWSGLQSTDILVAHNAKFEQHFSPGDGNPWIDTYKVARIVWPDAPGHSNQVLRYWLDVSVDEAMAMPPHRALPDAYVTALILVRLLEHKTPEEMVQISAYPALLKIMNFGKHKGMKFEVAPLDYLEWIRDKSDMDEDTKFTARYWLKKRTSK